MALEAQGVVRIDCGSQTIRYEVRPPIAEVVPDRPEHGNTFTPELLAELADATGRLATEAGVRAVILRGEGGNDAGPTPRAARPARVAADCEALLRGR